MSSDMQFKECSLDSIIREQIHKYASVFIGKKLKLDYAGVEECVRYGSEMAGICDWAVPFQCAEIHENRRRSVFIFRSRVLTRW